MKCSISDTIEIHVVAEGYNHCQCGKTTRAPIEYNYSPCGNIRVDPKTGNVGIGSVKCGDGYYWMKTHPGFGDEIYDGWALIQIMDGNMYLHGSEEYWPVDHSKEKEFIASPEYW